MKTELQLTPIDGGFHLKDLNNGHCIDVLRMLYNWRLVESDGYAGQPHMGIVHAYCFFGFDRDENGDRRTMETAFHRAVAAGLLWDGTGDPIGFDKKVF